MFSSQAILLEHITGDVETRYLYEVLAEASLVFPGVFPVMYVCYFSSLSFFLIFLYNWIYNK